MLFTKTIPGYDKCSDVCSREQISHFPNFIAELNDINMLVAIILSEQQVFKYFGHVVQRRT